MRDGLIITDGGRGAAGFSVANDAGDCVSRAIAIAAELPYREVYDAVAALSADHGGRRSARDGITKKVVRRAFEEFLGWAWTPTMKIGSGCQVHLRPDELPSGRLVVNLSKHVCAVVDGVVYDNADPRRGGTRCVYGYWRPTP